MRRYSFPLLLALLAVVVAAVLAVAIFTFEPAANPP